MQTALSAAPSSRASSSSSALSAIGGASWLVPERVDTPELLDLGTGSPDDVHRSLRDLRRINRWLGGNRALALALFPRLRAERTATVLDLGAGSGDMAALVARWAARRGLNVRVLALDLAARNLALARSHGTALDLLQADALHLPCAPQSVDYVVSSLFLHHFPPETVVDLLRAAATIARRAVIMTDLVRGWLPLAAFRLGQPVFARSYITRHDGAASVRRAYTPAEMLALAHAADLSSARVERRWAWRMTLTAVCS